MGDRLSPNARVYPPCFQVRQPLMRARARLTTTLFGLPSYAKISFGAHSMSGSSQMRTGCAQIDPHVSVVCAWMVLATRDQDCWKACGCCPQTYQSPMWYSAVWSAGSVRHGLTVHLEVRVSIVQPINAKFTSCAYRSQTVIPMSFSSCIRVAMLLA